MRLLFAGDVVLRQGKLDISAVVDMAEFDYRIVNFEAPVSRGHELPAIKAGPNLCQKSEALDAVLSAGFNVVALANNHIFDYGVDAAFYTENLFRKRGVFTCGIGRNDSEIFKPLLFEKNGEKLAILNLAEGQFGVSRHENDIGYAWIMSPKSLDIIHSLAKDEYKVIVFAHAGLEDEQYPLPEWQDVYRAFIDAGSYAVVASHPHIVQGWEVYNGKRIYYSLGNFAFDKENANMDWRRGLILSIDTSKDEFIEIPVVYETGRVIRDDSKSFMKERRKDCTVITDRAHLENIANKTASKLWEAFYRDYYLEAFPIGKRDIVSLVMSKLEFVKSSRRVNEVMLYHNIAIETHNWVVKRYLSEKYRNEWGIE